MDKSEATRTPAKRRKQVATVLRDAAELVNRGWTQGDYARDAAGHEVDPRDPEAVCWCAQGAIWKAGCTAEFQAISVLCTHINDTPGWYVDTVIAWNDHPDRTAEEVATTMRECAELVALGEL